MGLLSSKPALVFRNLLTATNPMFCQGINWRRMTERGVERLQGTWHHTDSAGKSRAERVVENPLAPQPQTWILQGAVLPRRKPGWLLLPLWVKDLALQHFTSTKSCNFRGVGREGLRLIYRTELITSFQWLNPSNNKYIFIPLGKNERSVRVFVSEELYKGNA